MTDEELLKMAYSLINNIGYVVAEAVEYDNEDSDWTGTACDIDAVGALLAERLGAKYLPILGDDDEES